MLLVPYGQAPHKRVEGEPGAELRLEMAALAAGDEALLEASPIEVERDGPSYTFRTLELLHERHPDDELTLLMGADVAAHLDGWRDPARVVALARLGIADRPGSRTADVEAALDRIGAPAHRDLVPMPELGVSSTDIRRRVAAGRPVRDLVPAPVEELIARRGLYREAVTA